MQIKKTYNLGKLQKSNMLKIMDDLFFCPKCKSKDISWIFYINIGGVKTENNRQLERCNKCKYEDEKGKFIQLNIINNREIKINEILNGY